jgi:transcriptional regulator with XRE-family HTH domain
MRQTQVTLGARIRQVRGTLSQRELAQLVGVDQNTVSKWERDKLTPSLRALRLLASQTGVPVGWFYEGLDGGDVAAPTPIETVNRRLDRIEQQLARLREQLDALAGQ